MNAVPITRLSDLLRSCAFVLLLATLAGRAAAQAVTPPATADAAPKLDKIEVTGSSIKRIEAETALPVQILKREDILRSGATTAEDLFRQISAASSAGTTVTAQATGFQTGSISTISLRGLGSARTLVLINGRRTAVYGGSSAGAAGSSVDIGSIPIAAIERVEILKDGASAVYGSDAIAGVVNFIMRKDYQGAEVTLGGGEPTHGSGADDTNLSLFAGKGDLATDKYNVSLAVGIQHITSLPGADRSFASRYSPAYGNDVTSGFAFPANVALPSGLTRNPAYPNCGPYSIVDVNFSKRCRFDNSPYDSLVPDQKKQNISAAGHLAIDDSTELYGEASYAVVKTTTTIQPVPLSYQNALLPGNPYNTFLTNLLNTQYPGYHNAAIGPGSAAFLLPPSSPYYPTAFAIANGVNGQPLNLVYRDFANGQRITADTADTSRFVAGFKGVAFGWDYDTSLLWSSVKVNEDLLSGFALYSQIMPLLDSGTINPFGPTTDPNALAAAKAAEFTGNDFTTQTGITSLSAKASRDLYALPAGPLTMATGVELRRETFSFNPALALQQGDITGQGGNQLPESAQRYVESAFLEFDAPITHEIEGDAAVRYDNYQGVGDTVNPKASLRWQPDPAVLVRASAGSGFRAPSLTDLYAPQTSSVTSNGTRDPVQCPVFNANNPACSFQFTTITGGNPNLKPEKSRSYTLGVLLEPVNNLSLGADAFWIFLKNQIVDGGLSYATILQNAQTAAQYASFVTRNASGQIVSISQTNANLFKVALSGVDLDFKYALALKDAGRISLLANGTYFFRFDSQNPDGSYTGEIDQGLTAGGGLVSRWRYTASALYDLGPWSASLTQNYQKSYHDVPSNISGVARDVSSYVTYDTQVAYRGFNAIKLAAGVRNIFNRAPPYANYAASANNFVGGYDLSYGNPVGTFVYVNGTYYFK